MLRYRCTQSQVHIGTQSLLLSHCDLVSVTQSQLLSLSYLVSVTQSQLLGLSCSVSVTLSQSLGFCYLVSVTWFLLLRLDFSCPTEVHSIEFCYYS